MDIETKADKRLLEVFLENIQAPKTYKDEEKIREYILKKEQEANKEMCINPNFNEILCIGIKQHDKPGVLMTLEEYAAWLKESTVIGNTKVQNLYQKMITFNGKRFDIPTIIRSGIKNNIDLPFYELAQQCDKYKAKNHIDMMQELALDYQDYTSLDKYLQIYLGIAKTPIDFETATDDEIKTHCLEDLENTAKLFMKFKGLFIWRGTKDVVKNQEEVFSE